jgi:tetratricopeptide (TPR) repeat protein
MKNFGAILFLAVFLFLLVAAIGSINTLFDLHLVNKYQVPFPEDWLSVIVFLGIAVFLFLIALMLDSDKIGNKYKAIFLIGIAMLIIGGIIALSSGDKNNYNYAFKLGEEKFKDENYKGAILDYNDAIQGDTNEYYYYQRRGLAKELINELDSSLNDYNKAIKLKPKDGYLYYLRGALKFKMKDSINGLIDLHMSESMGCKDATEFLDLHK